MKMMNKFKTTELGAEHIDDVTDLEQICFSHPISRKNLELLLLGEMGKGFVSYDTEKASVAAYGGVIVAGGEAQVLNVATHPDYRRKGLAKEIMSRIIDHSVLCDAEYITLEVREKNVPAISLYRSIGFYEVGRIKEYYKDPNEDALILKKVLSR